MTATPQTLDQVIKALEANLQARKGMASNDSYVASLYNQGLNKILEKIGEESTEVILAAKDFNQTPTSTAALTNECADLIFHMSVALAHLDIPIEAVFRNLEERLGISGHLEKASRAT